MELQEIINDENFKSLGNTDKQVVLKGYFDDNLADDEFRNLDEETKNQVYSGFYNDHLGLEPTQEIEPVTENIITVDTPDTVPSEEAIMTQPIETVERNIQEDAIAKEEDEISLIVSRAEQLAMSGLVMNQAIGAIDSLATNKDVTDKEQNAINLALDSLYKTEKIVAHKQSEEDGQYYVMTANGNELPLDAGFLDTLKADSNKLIQAGASAYATTKAASTIIKDPRALIPIALMGSATGAATGGVQDAMISANILGVPFTPKDILETAANHGTDDLLLGGLANTAYKLAKAFGGTVSKKFKRIYNTIVNDDIDGAFDEMMKLSNKNPDEQQKIINMGAKLFGKNVPDTSTNEGKREAIKYLALFDDSIQSYTMSGLS